MEKGLSIILPSYKESENLKKILPKIHSVLMPLCIPYEILVVDTMNPMDETEEICNENKASYIPRKGGNFYGDAIHTGFSTAKYLYTVVMDADGSHNPEDIVRFLNEIKDYDIVIGSRYCKGGETDNNFILRFMSYVLNLSYRIVFGIKAKDVSNSYRMYYTEQIKKLNLECINFDIVEEILIKLNVAKKGFAIKEVPIKFNKREFGESKRDLKKFIVSYITTMKKMYDIKLVAQGKENTLLSRIIKFGITGGIGAFLNLFVFFIIADRLNLNSNFASCIAFLIAVTHNYIANKLWTFRLRSKENASFIQWVKYVGTNLVGLACNLIVLNTLIYYYDWKFLSVPQLIGILVGMVFNFIFANYFVFAKAKK